MNILFTNFCNLRCPYCFARGKFISEKASKDSYLSIKNLRIIINFLKKSRQREIGVIGGEPTLHPEFQKAVTAILNEGLNINIFSNGIINNDNVNFLKRFDENRCSILININTPKTYRREEWSKINSALKILNKQVVIGFTIYKKDFSLDFIIKLIKKYKLQKKIRIGLAAPLWGFNNRYLPLRDRREVAKKIVGFARICDNLDISLAFDCGFTLCDFTEEEYGKLFYYNSIFRIGCKPVIDVGPDLTVWRCFATSMIWNKKLTDFKNLADIYRFYNDKFKAFHRAGAISKCLRCKYLNRGQCDGACLGYTLKSFNLETRLGMIKSL